MTPVRTGSISRRLAWATMALIFTVFVAITALQMRVQYTTDVRNATARADEVKDSLVPNLAVAVWMVDEPRIGLLLDAAMRTWGLAHVRVRTREGDVYERGADPGEATIVRRMHLLQHEADTPIALGSVEVSIDDKAILAQVWQRTVSRALMLLAGIGVGAFSLLWLVRRLITRHLRALARYASEAGPDRLHIPLKLEGRDPRYHDEFDELVDSFNRMRMVMLEDQLRRRRDEAELTAHRERLEDLVAARTHELTETARELEAQRDAVQRLANIDALTGVSSRRHFQECADRELARAVRDGVPLSLLMLDIDYFKRINDTHGHGVGDLVLKRFAQVLQHHFGNAPCIGRLGGEEFAVVLPGWDTARAAVLAGLVRQAVAELVVAVAGPGEVRFTTSMGLATHRPDGDTVTTLESLLRDADAALYRAKAAGRNRLETAQPAPVQVD